MIGKTSRSEQDGVHTITQDVMGGKQVFTPSYLKGSNCLIYSDKTPGHLAE